MNLTSDRAKRAFVAFGLASAFGLCSLTIGSVMEVAVTSSATHSQAGGANTGPMSRQP